MSQGTYPPPSRAPRPSPRTPQRRRSGVQNLVVVLGILVVIAVIGVAAGVGYLWYRYNQIGREDLTLSGAGAYDPKNYLIVGSDNREVLDEDGSDAGAYFHDGVEHGGQRSDTIIILRVDPVKETIDMVSFPRDLWVPIAGTDYSEKINAAYNGGAQRLVDTIKQNFGIDIHHYVEIDMSSFQGIVDAVDGVPMYFDTPMRDAHTGLQIDSTGCLTLDGGQAIAFVRSRYLEYKDSKGNWLHDGTGDLGRINRQQVFMRKIIDRSVGRVADFDILAANEILSSTAEHLKVDTSMDIEQMIQLGKRFADFRGDSMITHTLPVIEGHHGDAFSFSLDDAGAQPILNIFRGIPNEPPSSTSPAVTDTTVRYDDDGDPIEVIDQPIGVAPEDDPSASCS